MSYRNQRRQEPAQDQLTGQCKASKYLMMPGFNNSLALPRRLFQRNWLIKYRNAELGYLTHAKLSFYKEYFKFQAAALILTF
jgi:hypothetical protein